MPLQRARTRKIGDSIIRVARYVAEASAVAMMLLIAADIIVRAVFRDSLLIADEVSGYLLVVMAFFGVAHSLRSGALLRIELLLFVIPARLRAGLGAAFDVLSLALIGLILWQVIAFAWSTWSRGMVAPTVTETPLWIPQIAMPVGCAILVLALVLELRDNLVRATGQEVERPGSARDLESNL